MNNTESIIIRLEDVNKTYGIEDTLVKALDGVNLTIAEGEYCAIMGPSGSGKSSAMNVIGCLDRPTSGHYYLDNLDVSTVADAELAKIRNRKLGFIFQQFHLLPQLTALDNVMLPMIYGGLPPSERKERAVVALEKVGLSNRMANRPNQLSGGQQQRVAIARALVNHPALVLADEPTGALDSTTSEEIMNLLTELNQQGTTIAIVTHDANVAARTKRIIRMVDGVIVESK